MANRSRFIIELIDKMSGPMRKIGSAIDALSRKSVKPAMANFKGLRTETAHVGRSMGGVGVGGIAMGNLIAQGAMKALTGLAELGKGAIGLVAEFTTFAQNSGLAFDALAKHGASGAKLFDHARNLAVEFGMDVQDTTKNFQKLLAAQFNPSLATDIIKMGADLRVLGSSSEQVGGAIRAITQIKGTGILQGDELNQLAEAGVSIDLIRQKMQKLLGVSSNAEVLKLQEAGKIDADTAIAAILDAIKTKTGEKELGEVGKKFADTTLDGMAGKLKARGQNLMTDLGKQMIPKVTAALGPLSARLDAFLASPKAQAMIDAIGNGLGQALTFVGKLIEKGIPLVQRFIGGFVDKLGPALPGIAASGERFLAALDKPELADTIQRWGERFGVLAATVGSIGGFVLEVIPSILRLGDAMTRPFDIVTEGAAALIAAAATWGPRIIDGLVGGIEAGVGRVASAASRVAGAVTGTLGKVFHFGSPSKAMEEKGEFISLGLTRGMANIDVGRALDNLVAGGSTVFSANDNGIAARAQGNMGPMAPSFAERPRIGDIAGGGGTIIHSTFAPVLTLTQQPGESSKEFLDDIETRMRRMIEDHEEELARAAGA